MSFNTNITNLTMTIIKYNAKGNRYTRKFTRSSRVKKGDYLEVTIKKS
jgi:hypothetical protein